MKTPKTTTKASAPETRSPKYAKYKCGDCGQPIGNGGYSRNKYTHEIWHPDCTPKPTQPKADAPLCSTHPEAPHGFDRNASHSEDRYVCDCKSWEAMRQLEQHPWHDAAEEAEVRAKVAAAQQQPAAPQPAKAAQDKRPSASHVPGWKFNELLAELERVKEALAVAQSQIDNNDATLAQVKLVHKSQLERVKQQLKESQAEVTRLNRGIVNDIAEREQPDGAPRVVCRICGQDAKLVNREWTCDHKQAQPAKSEHRSADELIIWLQESGSLQFDPNDVSLEEVCREAIRSAFTERDNLLAALKQVNAILNQPAALNDKARTILGADCRIARDIIQAAIARAEGRAE